MIASVSTIAAHAMPTAVLIPSVFALAGLALLAWIAMQMRSLFAEMTVMESDLLRARASRQVIRFSVIEYPRDGMGDALTALQVAPARAPLRGLAPAARVAA